jgi:tetratricopeptide (TPR) repeat protein
MTLVGQPGPSSILLEAYRLLSEGDTAEAEAMVRKAAIDAKTQHGSGSHPLAMAYADMARLHYRMGQYDRSAQEFQHAAKGPLPPNPQERRDRLTFLFGLGAALGAGGRIAEAEKVLRQSLTFARNLLGVQSATAMVALVPLADVLLASGRIDEARKLANEAYDALWKLGDPLFAASVGTRAEILLAAGRDVDPFADLNDLPDELVAIAVATTLNRAGRGDPARVRALLAELTAFVDKKFGDGHTLTYDVLAATAHHEAAAGENGDLAVRKKAVRRVVWSLAVRRLPGGLLTNLEVGFEADGRIHLAPHLIRNAVPDELDEVERVLTDAVDGLYSRPSFLP